MLVSDRACFYAFESTWMCYSDWEEHSFDRRILSKKGRAILARWRLYLAADDEPFPSFPGWWTKIFHRAEYNKALAFYPFADEAHLKRAETRYLARC